MKEKDKKHEENIELTWKDYVALFVASIETILLPAVVLIGVFLFLLILAARAR